MKQIELSAGPIEYEDTGGSGPTLVLLHGLLMDASLWDGLFMQQMRLRPVRRLPIAFGWLTKRGDAATRRWMKPVLSQREIRRDTVRVLRSISADKHLLMDVADRLATYDHPALVVWASEDRVMPPEHDRAWQICSPTHAS